MDEFGDRMKVFEGIEASRRLMPLLPAMARIDGRCFSNFTRGMRRPYDERLSDLMIATTAYLVEETGANMGYTQSDEISLTWYSSNFKSQIFFDGKIQKMVSQLAALASVKFNALLPDYFPKSFSWPFSDEMVYTDLMPVFDTRVWNVPNVVEGANTFLFPWQHDLFIAIKNYF